MPVFHTGVEIRTQVLKLTQQAPDSLRDVLPGQTGTLDRNMIKEVKLLGEIAIVKLVGS